ncbi:MAG: adenine phosphoribosyltransferase [Dehalococcoidia bacterium]|nr:adenine phosphoribosyltransferase [Dehalococcoidia bacterium]
MNLKEYVRDIPDFPTEGILFRDITPMLKDPTAFGYAVDALAERYSQRPFDIVVAIEARGFLFGSPLAYRLGKPLIPARKQGKLPYESIRADYSLEYGTNVVEMHTDAVAPGASVLIVDDLLATGGTLAATARLVELAGGRVEEVALVIELEDLGGRKRLRGYDVFSLVQY